MYPVICQIGPFSVYSFGVMLAIAAIVCSYLMAQDAQRQGIAKNVVYDFFFWVVLTGILGARIFYIALNWDFYVVNPQEVFMIQNGGLAWQGSLITGMAVAWIFMRVHKLPVLSTFDLAAPYMALGHAIGRIGCFLNGCCYGRHWDHGLYFPSHQDKLHPTQLYEFFLLVTIFFVLKIYRQNKKMPGDVLVMYLYLASAERLIVEFFRGDHATTWMGLSIFQWVSVGVFAAAFVLQQTLKTARK